MRGAKMVSLTYRHVLYIPREIFLPVDVPTGEVLQLLNCDAKMVNGFRVAFFLFGACRVLCLGASSGNRTVGWSVLVCNCLTWKGAALVLHIFAGALVFRWLI